MNENIIVALALMGGVVTAGFIWLIIMAEEIRHKQVEIFDRILKITTIAQVERNELLEEIYECENNPDFHGHSEFGHGHKEPGSDTDFLNVEKFHQSGHVTPWGLATIVILTIALAHTVFVRWL